MTVKVGDIYETTDKRRPLRRLRVARIQRYGYECDVSRKTDKGWTGYTGWTELGAGRLNPHGGYRLVRK